MALILNIRGHFYFYKFRTQIKQYYTLNAN
jgi:hypothetical protein